MIRLIARLDIKGPNLVKTVHLEGLRVLGDPQTFATQYYLDGADELIYMDVVASLYGRNNLTEIITHTAQNIFIPLTVGGGVRSLDDANKLLRAGADKVAINTAATKNPKLLSELALSIGSQSVVLSIEAKKNSASTWEAYTDSGREKTGLDVVEWAIQGERLGAGEILLTSVDQEGTKKGFDLDLLKAVTDAVGIPVIASGGLGSVDHLEQAVKVGKVQAVAMADILHYKKSDLKKIRIEVQDRGIEVRPI